MNPHPEHPEELLHRLKVLEQENEMLADRAEEISLLGLVAEQVAAEEDPRSLLAGLLERICVLKGLPYGAVLEDAGGGPELLAAYHLRRPEQPAKDRFVLRPPGTLPASGGELLDPGGREARFLHFEIDPSPLAPRSLALLPFLRQGRPAGFFIFADENRGVEEFRLLLPLLQRVTEMGVSRLDNLALVRELRRANRVLDLAVEERTAELQEREEHYRILFDHVPDAVLLVGTDGQDNFGKIVEANEVAARMHGYSLAELRSMHVEDLDASGSPPQLESFEARIWRLRPGETVQEELLHRRKDGSTFPVEAIGTLVEIRGRQFVLGFSRDITQRKEAEQILLRTQRTESVGVLAGGIAHDFNNLLTAIMGQTFIALEKLEDVDEGRVNLERALNAAEKASILTQQMLAYSGRGKFTIQSIALDGMIRDNLHFLEAAIPKNVRFELDFAEGLPRVTGDLGQLQQVVMNLVINGAEAIGEQPGQIKIRTSALHLAEEELQAWSLGANHLPTGYYVVVDVADDGCGMDPATLARVFDPFFSTKAKGHGLGLAAVQGIVRGHHGGLRVESRVGAGTCFRVALPAGDPPPAPAPALEPEPIQASSHRALRVLVVDDEEYMQEVVRDILAVNGHRALLAGSGEEALDLFRSQPGTIDVVLLDLTMPGMGGHEAFRKLREIDPKVKVILSSGYAEEEATQKVLGMDLSGFLQKPYPAKELVRLLEALFP